MGGLKLNRHKHASKELDHDGNKITILKAVPWIESPVPSGDAAGKDLAFAQRHEANALELFFDLFFVANLATFTAYHSITDWPSLYAYIGFFVIIWETWFQITLHDVRFARDTIFERACKTTQMIAFVGFALVGSHFRPGSLKANNDNFETLCYVLIMSRLVLITQYSVVLFFCRKEGHSHLYMPLYTCIATYFVAAVGFATLVPGFRSEERQNTLFVVYYIVIALETAAIIGISILWKALRFEKTHLVERMGLLTLIVIGEGAIGVTKTVTRLMGKYGLDFDSFVIVLCIVLLMMLIWMIYFDNQPHHHHGPAQQIIWAFVHLPLHLAIVGTVEGAQQIAAARYFQHSDTKLTKYIASYCYKQNLSGSDLVKKFSDIWAYFQLDKKPETLLYRYLPGTGINDTLERIANQTAICAPDAVAGYDPASRSAWPKDIQIWEDTVAGAIFTGLGIKIDPSEAVLHHAYTSFQVVYVYFWLSVALLLVCMMICMTLVNKRQVTISDLINLASRFAALLVVSYCVAISRNAAEMYDFLETAAILPLVTVLLLMIVIVDRISGIVTEFARKRRLRSKGLAGDEMEKGRRCCHVSDYEHWLKATNHYEDSKTHLHEHEAKENRYSTLLPFSTSTSSRHIRMRSAHNIRMQHDEAVPSSAQAS